MRAVALDLTRTGERALAADDAEVEEEQVRAEGDVEGRDTRDGGRAEVAVDEQPEGLTRLALVVQHGGLADRVGGLAEVDDRVLREGRGGHQRERSGAEKGLQM